MNLLNKIRVTVDYTDFKIKEPRPFDKGWFSHKFKGPGVRYLVAVSVVTGWIVWIEGPFMCGLWPDCKIANERLVHLLEEDERYFGDRGFRGGIKAITPYQLTGEQNQPLKRLAAVARARHKTVNARIKSLKILQDQFRHDPTTQHGVVFDAIAKITQLQMESGRSIFSLEREMEQFWEGEVERA